MQDEISYYCITRLESREKRILIENYAHFTSCHVWANQELAFFVDPDLHPLWGGGGGLPH